MRPKCNLTEEERNRILPKIDSWITDEEEEELRERMPKYLFYWYDNGRRHTYCSGCGVRDRGTLGKITHGQKVCCMVWHTLHTVRMVDFGVARTETFTEQSDSYMSLWLGCQCQSRRRRKRDRRNWYYGSLGNNYFLDDRLWINKP